MGKPIEKVPPKVLVVDDDEIIREAAHESLEEAGFVVRKADDGLQALKVLETFCPDVILLDVMMANMDGFTTTSAVRKLPDHEAVPILIMTALNDLDSITRAYEAGATDFIMKPINWMILIQRLRYMTRASRVLKEQQRLQNELIQAQKMEAIGRLAGGVAHDLNNILTGVVSYPDLLLHGLSEDDPLRAPIQTIKKSGEKAAAIVQDLLTLARRGVVAREEIAINDIIVEYLESPECAEIMSHHRNVEIRKCLQKDLPPLSGSPVHLSKALMNIISNAAEAIEDEGVIKITSFLRDAQKPQKPNSRVKATDYIVVSISDTGIGMSPEESKKIFEPFYTRKKMGRSGTGLGMSVVWGTVKDHDGIIEVNTAIGRGTAFDLYFPVSDQTEGRKNLQQPTKTQLGNGETILVVDDLKEQRDIAVKMLSQLGYRVLALSSGEKAIAHMQKHSADLILLDMIMEPGIDGLSTYENIVKIHPRQKAVLTSGYSQTERVHKAQKFGAGQYLKKPYTLEALSCSIKAELTS